MKMWLRFNYCIVKLIFLLIGLKGWISCLFTENTPQSIIPGRLQILWDNEKDILEFITRHPRVSSTEVEQGLKSIALANIITMYLLDFSKSMILGSHVLSSLLHSTLSM